MKMKKDERLQSAFEEYFEGNGAPECDLGAAKRALYEARLKKKRRTKTIVSVLSACASVALIVTLCFVFSPSFRIGDWGTNADPVSPGDNSAMSPDLSKAQPYSLASAETRSASYSDFTEQEKELLKDFVSFSFAQNASCSYTVYTYREADVLVRADISYTSGNTRLWAEVYTDLTDGEYFAEEFVSYKSLPSAGSYRCETEYLNGEYVSRILWTEGATRVADVTSPTERGAAALMEYFLA